jgi:SAM-dependent methyltransferase
MSTVRAHEWRWKADGGYYTDKPTQLQERPLRPDFQRIRDRQLAALFDRYLPPSGQSSVLELGCGASRWLPYLAIHKGCEAVGVDYEPSAVELTVANMRGAGAEGAILCRDAFDWRANADLLDRFDLVYSLGLLEHFDDVVERIRSVVRYVRTDGVVLTMVPNFQGINWLLQRYGDLGVLQTHVVYDVAQLRRRHEEAGLVTLTAGYTGFYDGFVSDTAPSTPAGRRRRHQAICRASNIAARAWLRATREWVAPELSWLAPMIYYVGRRI